MIDWAEAEVTQPAEPDRIGTDRANRPASRRVSETDDCTDEPTNQRSSKIKAGREWQSPLTVRNERVR